MILIPCDNCGKEYEKEEKKVNWNRKIDNRNYCCKQCQKEAKSKTTVLNCTNCGQEIERIPSEMKRSKSGNYFCSKTCAITVNNMLCRTGENNPNYKNGIGGYRSRALEYYDNKCSICGYNVINVLEVHHKDGDRKNNGIGNLDILCPTHHKEFTVGVRTY